MAKRKDDSTIARIAGNLLSGLEDSHDRAAEALAVEFAVRVMANVFITDTELCELFLQAFREVDEMRSAGERMADEGCPNEEPFCDE